MDECSRICDELTLLCEKLGKHTEDFGIVGSVQLLNQTAEHKSVRWGMATLLSKQLLWDFDKGRSNRDNVRLLYEKRVKDNEEVQAELGETMMAEVLKVVAYNEGKPKQLAQVPAKRLAQVPAKRQRKL